MCCTATKAVWKSVWDAFFVPRLARQTASTLKPQKTPMRIGFPPASVTLACTTSITRGVFSAATVWRSEEHTSELQSHLNLVCRLLLEKKKTHHRCSIGYESRHQLAGPRAEQVLDYGVLGPRHQHYH